MKKGYSSKLKLVSFVSLFLFFSLATYSQDEGPDPPPEYEDDGPDPPPAAPIDDSIVYLFIGGMVIGAVKFYELKKSSS